MTQIGTIYMIPGVFLYGEYFALRISPDPADPNNLHIVISHKEDPNTSMRAESLTLTKCQWKELTSIVEMLMMTKQAQISMAE